MPPPVRPHEHLQNIIDGVDLNQHEYAMLTYRTTTSAAAYVAPQSAPTPTPSPQTQPYTYSSTPPPAPNRVDPALLNSPPAINSPFAYNQGTYSAYQQPCYHSGAAEL